MLSDEDEDDFFDLQIVKHYDGEVRDLRLGDVKGRYPRLAGDHHSRGLYLCERKYFVLPAGGGKSLLKIVTVLTVA